MNADARYGGVALGVESAQPAARRNAPRHGQWKRLLHLLARALLRLG
jgi:hypothetical protein